KPSSTGRCQFIRVSHRLPPILEASGFILSIHPMTKLTLLPTTVNHPSIWKMLISAAICSHCLYLIITFHLSIERFL
ncbi:hypothetical protein P879_06458, partial [Paragonimus westermani]